MESTGVYWIPLFGVLEERGFEVMLVDPRCIKNVPGRKTDVLDCQWLQQLHTCGLLSGAFRPDGEIRRLRRRSRRWWSPGRWSGARRRVRPQPPRPGPAVPGSPGPVGGHGPT